MDESLRRQVADYLDNCPVILAWMGRTEDIIGQKFTAGDAILSDGRFYWRHDAGAYVRFYGVAVPQEALDYMQSQNWKPPVFSESDYWELFEILDAPYREYY